MWQLVIMRGGKPSRRTQFPIFERRAAYRARAPAMIRGVGRSDRGTLERLQPFYRSRGGLPPGGHPLAMLARLSNTDKHQVIHAAVTRLGLHGDVPRDDNPRVIKGIPNEDAGKILKETWRRDIELDDGNEIVRFRLAPIGPNPEVTMNYQLGVSVSFGLNALGSFLPYVREGVEHVMDTFEPAFYL